MAEQELAAIAQTPVAQDKGILAADESTDSIARRFATVVIESTEASRRAYREPLFTTPGIEAFISGVIMYDETIRQADREGTPFPILLAARGIIPGIKVDRGAYPLAGFPGERITEGLDGLRERLLEYRRLGAKFAKWRAVMVQGSLTVIAHLREHGGALINIGSIESDRALPLQSHYSASKQAAKGFTEALRMELEKEGAPISVTLVKPASIATPLPQHAKNYMAVEPTLPPPVYAPAVVAETILQCAQRPVRDVIVGGGGRLLSSLGYLMPRLMDRLMEAKLFDQQKAGPRQRPSEQTNLYAPVQGSGRERGEINRHIMQSSLYTQAALHPMLTLTGLVALTLGVMRALRPRS